MRINVANTDAGSLARAINRSYQDGILVKVDGRQPATINGSLNVARVLSSGEVAIEVSTAGLMYQPSTIWVAPGESVTLETTW